MLNPQKGFWNTSNNYLIPPGWPHKEALHYMWADPFRAASVAESLGSGRMFAVVGHDRAAEQTICRFRPAAWCRCCAICRSPVPTSQAQDRLLHWNYVLDKDSVAAGIYEMWQRRLQTNVRALVVPEEAQPFIGNLAMTKIIGWLQAPDGRFGADPIAARNALLSKSLEEGVAELAKRLGPDMEKWKLGAYHHALIQHAMSAAMKPELRAKFDVGDLPRGGDGYTITATGSGDNQTVRRIIQDRCRHGGLGQLGRIEQPGPVWRRKRPALSRSL